jgi:hypothetical protein
MWVDMVMSVPTIAFSGFVAFFQNLDRRQPILGEAIARPPYYCGSYVGRLTACGPFRAVHAVARWAT